MALLAAGCGGEDGGSPATASGSPAKAAAQDDPSLYRITDKGFDRTKFSDPTTIDNRYFPLPVGTQFVYEGRSDRGQGRRRHRVIFTVTDLSKVIDGVRTRVMWDRDINAGRLLEGELAFFAQDDDGHVWAFGEYPEEYEPDGSFGGAPDTWIVGRERARAGLHMRADPRPGTPSYLQGWAPAIEFSDRAKVLRTGRRACVPTGCYRDVLVTDETNPLEPRDGHQLKFYAPGVGNIRAAPGRGGKEREVLELVEIRRLGAAALARVRRAALELEDRAYRAADVYKGTPRATPDS
ncbi:MAG TPA: hypothetical protein VN213_11955 [Solirubrobacteraceae bacterium]|nr:hypothetical protein [Solirubrobacteraceae bacterium]